jgi:myotubularin-related protein 5/13
MRNLCGLEFGRQMLNCMFFNMFVSKRGLPWRHCDNFDDLYSVYGDQCALEREDPSRTLIHIKILAEELYRNETQLTTLNLPYAA